MERDAKAKDDDVLTREIRDLKEATRNLQTTRERKSLEYEDLCVQPGIDQPVGYNPPKFDIFNGIDDPDTHLRAYYDRLDFMDGFRFNNDITPYRLYLTKLRSQLRRFVSMLYVGGQK
ncbi:hypothetical protein HAX54_006682 [Datura stramonium]|uniref:Uncharacterized protein n=1 Tax=Datura stramonium TaxID=4076 RepID=A0ABS8WU78_DATST|nr:hypothetical protein [Datura stramonium]